ncbi:MAG: hypothetical protein ABI134_00310 [Byssovorax sp.]
MMLSFQGSFTLEEIAGSPLIRVGATGLLAHARELGVGKDTVSFGLTCSYKLPEAVSRCFAEVSHALTLFVEDPGGGRAAAIRLEDPTMLYYPMPTPSFLASRGAGDRRDVLIGGNVSAIVEVSGFARRDPPTLFARVALQSYMSPTLELRFADRTVGVYLQGKPYALELFNPPPG